MFEVAEAYQVMRRWRRQMAPWPAGCQFHFGRSGFSAPMRYLVPPLRA